MKTNRLLCLGALLALSTLNPQLSTALAQSTAFTYQGRLTDNGAPANGDYDLRFTIYGSSGEPTVVAGPLTNSPTAVSKGLFTVTLDFGAGVFAGANRWLEIALRTSSTGAFTVLTPRQAITATPYALTASNLSGTLPATQLTGTLPNARLSASVSLLGQAIDSAEIADGSILNADISPSAAIADTKLATIASPGKVGDSALSANVALRIGGNAFSGPQTLDGNVTLPPSRTLSWGSGSSLLDHQGGAIELGNSLANGTVPFIDFHYGVSSNQDYNVRLINNENGWLSVEGNLRASGRLVVDQAGQNNGTIAPNSLTFGTYFSGEGIASKRTPGGNRWGLDFYTASQNRMSIDVSGNVGIGTTTPTEKLQVAGTVTAQGFSGNGTGLTSLDASQLTSGTVPESALGSAWKTAGNGGTTPGTHFLGTTDNRPLTLKVNNVTALEVRPAPTVPNVIGGLAAYRPSVVASGVSGAVIAGGNAPSGAVLGHGAGDFQAVYDNDGTVGGGFGNKVGSENGDVTDAAFATVAGGVFNTASGFGAAVGGGDANWADGSRAVVAGGYANRARSDFSFVGGGEANDASGGYATIPGGTMNRASGPYSFAAGCRARADHRGSFVWADLAGYDFASTAENQFSLRAVGGVRFVTGLNGSVPSAGVEVPPGSGSWSSLSDRAAKTNLQPVDTHAVLERLAAVPLQTWNYKAEPGNVCHLGPTAQDFHAAFGLGADDKTIATVDADGVALAAIQGLNAKVDDRGRRAEVRIQNLEAENAQLKARLEKLEQLLNAKMGGAL